MEEILKSWKFSRIRKIFPGQNISIEKFLPMKFQLIKFSRIPVKITLFPKKIAELVRRLHFKWYLILKIPKFSTNQGDFDHRGGGWLARFRPQGRDRVARCPAASGLKSPWYKFRIVWGKSDFFSGIRKFLGKYGTLSYVAENFRKFQHLPSGNFRQQLSFSDERRSLARAEWDEKLSLYLMLGQIFQRLRRRRPPIYQ